MNTNDDNCEKEEMFETVYVMQRPPRLFNSNNSQIIAHHTNPFAQTALSMVSYRTRARNTVFFIVCCLLILAMMKSIDIGDSKSHEKIETEPAEQLFFKQQIEQFQQLETNQRKLAMDTECDDFVIEIRGKSLITDYDYWMHGNKGRLLVVADDMVDPPNVLSCEEMHAYYDKEEDEECEWEWRFVYAGPGKMKVTLSNEANSVYLKVTETDSYLPVTMKNIDLSLTDFEGASVWKWDVESKELILVVTEPIFNSSELLDYFSEKWDAAQNNQTTNEVNTRNSTFGINYRSGRILTHIVEKISHPFKIQSNEILEQKLNHLNASLKNAPLQAFSVLPGIIFYPSTSNKARRDTSLSATNGPVLFFDAELSTILSTSPVDQDSGWGKGTVFSQKKWFNDYLGTSLWLSYHQIASDGDIQLALNDGDSFTMKNSSFKGEYDTNSQSLNYLTQLQKSQEDMLMGLHCQILRNAQHMRFQGRHPNSELIAKANKNALFAVGFERSTFEIDMLIWLKELGGSEFTGLEYIKFDAEDATSNKFSVYPLTSTLKNFELMEQNEVLQICEQLLKRNCSSV